MSQSANTIISNVLPSWQEVFYLGDAITLTSVSITYQVFFVTIEREIKISHEKD